MVERLLTKEEWRQTDADGGQRTGTVALVRVLKDLPQLTHAAARDNAAFLAMAGQSVKSVSIRPDSGAACHRVHSFLHALDGRPTEWAWRGCRRR